MARILVIDDAVFMRKLFVDTLTGQGHEIVGEGRNAKEAVAKFNALKPDLMTMDIVMPRESGIDTPEAVRQIIQENPNAKIIIISSQDQQDIITEMLKAGACDFILKPFRRETVIKTVNRILGI